MKKKLFVALLVTLLLVAVFCITAQAAPSACPKCKSKDIWITGLGGNCKVGNTYTLTCNNCKYSYSWQDPVDPNNHDGGHREIVPPTCTEFGYIVDYCDTCGKQLSSKRNALPLGHEMYCLGAPLANPITKCQDFVIYAYCQRCDYKEYQYTEHQHKTGCTTVVQARIAPTCSKDGKQAIIKCSNCGKTTGGEVIPAKGGTCDFSKLTSYATNLVKHTCSKCGNYKICIASSCAPSVTLSNVAGGVQISWKKVTNAKGYYVYRDGKKIATITGNATVTYTDKNVTSGTSYKYSAAAWYKDSKGYGSSTQGTNKTICYVARPASVTQGFQNGRVIVSWKAVTGASGYQLQVKSGSTVKYSTSGNYTSFQIAGVQSNSGLTRGATYTLYVRSYKKVGSTTYYSAWTTKSVKIP